MSRREERRADAERRQRESRARKPFEERLAAIDAQLEALGREAAQTEAWLAGTEAYDAFHRERLQAALKRRGETAGRIALLEDEWLGEQARMEEELARLRGG